MFNPQTRKILKSRNICWADWHGQTSLIAGFKDFNVERDIEIVDIPIDDEKHDKDVVPVVPPIQQQDIDSETAVPVVKQKIFMLAIRSSGAMRLTKMLQRKKIGTRFETP